MASKKPDDRIKALQKLSQNKVCFDCGRTGLMPDVCLTFGIFICTTCSSIHREFEHRINTVNVTTFSEVQAAAMEAKGNEKVRAEYLSNFPDNRRPTPENRAQIKAFIRDTFVNKLFVGKPGETTAAAAAASTAAPVSVTPAPSARPHAPALPISSRHDVTLAAHPTTKVDAAPTVSVLDVFQSTGAVETKSSPDANELAKSLAKVLATYMSAHGLTVATLSSLLPHALKHLQSQESAPTVAAPVIPTIAASQPAKVSAPAVPARKPAVANEDALFGAQFEAVFGDDTPEPVSVQPPAQTTPAQSDPFAAFGAVTAQPAAVAPTQDMFSVFSSSQTQAEPVKLNSAPPAPVDDPFGADPFGEPEVPTQVAKPAEPSNPFASSSNPFASSSNPFASSGAANPFAFDAPATSPAATSATTTHSMQTSSAFDTLASTKSDNPFSGSGFGATSGVGSGIGAAVDDDDVFGAAMAQGNSNSVFGAAFEAPTTSSTSAATTQKKAEGTSSFKFKFSGDDDDDDGDAGGNPFADAPQPNQSLGFGQTSNTGGFGNAVMGMPAGMGQPTSTPMGGMGMAQPVGSPMGAMGMGMPMMGTNPQFQQMMMQMMSQMQAGGQMNPMQQQQMMQMFQQQAMMMNQGGVPPAFPGQTQTPTGGFGGVQVQPNFGMAQPQQAPQQNTSQAKPDFFAGAFGI